VPQTATGSVLFTCSTCIYIVNSPFASREDMFENLGVHRPGVRNVHFRLPSMAQRRGVLKAPHCHRAKHVLCKGRMGTSQSYRQGYKWIRLKKKPLSVLQFLNTQLDVMTNVTSLKSIHLRSSYTY